MSTVPLHPALVHVPMGLALALPLVAAGLALALWRGRVPRRTWLVAVALQALLVAGGVAALRTGEPEARRIESLVGEGAVEAHEEAAEAFLWGAGAVLALAIAVLAAPARLAAAAALASTVGTVAVAGLALRTGKAGGELVYARGAAAAYAGGPARLEAPDPRPRHGDRRHHSRRAE